MHVSMDDTERRLDGEIYGFLDQFECCVSKNGDAFALPQAWIQSFLSYSFHYLIQSPRVVCFLFTS